MMSNVKAVDSMSSSCSPWFPESQLDILEEKINKLFTEIEFVNEEINSLNKISIRIESCVNNRVLCVIALSITTLLLNIFTTIANNSQETSMCNNSL